MESYKNGELFSHLLERIVGSVGDLGCGLAVTAVEHFHNVQAADVGAERYDRLQGQRIRAKEENKRLNGRMAQSDK